MPLPLPTSVLEMVADGAIAQAEIDHRLALSLGPISAAEFSGARPDEAELDAEVHVRLHVLNDATVDLPGNRIAVVRHGVWQWLTVATSSVELPELHSNVRASVDIERAARTLCGNRPLVYAPHDDGSSSVVVIDPRSFTPVQESVRTVISRGLAHLLPAADARRAINSWATTAGIPVSDSDAEITLGGNLTVTFDQEQPTSIIPGPTLESVHDDGAVISHEHQLFFHSRFPTATVSLSATGEQATLTSSSGATVTVAASVLGHVQGDSFTWAWEAPAGVGKHNAAQAVRNQGIRLGIPALWQMTHPAREVDSLVTAAKPLLGWWTHARVQVDEEREAVVLLDSPMLHLPPATDAAVEATLAGIEDLPVTDLRRALTSYAGFRRLPMRTGLTSISLALPNTGRAVDVPLG